MAKPTHAAACLQRLQSGANPLTVLPLERITADRLWFATPSTSNPAIVYRPWIAIDGSGYGDPAARRAGQRTWMVEAMGYAYDQFVDHLHSYNRESDETLTRYHALWSPERIGHLTLQYAALGIVIAARQGGQQRQYIEAA